MPTDTVSLRLEGEQVPLDAFTRAIDHLQRLLSELEREVTAKGEIEWMIVELNTGSTSAAVKGTSKNTSEVEKVTNAYESIGHSLESDSPPPYSEPVRREVDGITSVLNDHVTAVALGVGHGSERREWRTVKPSELGPNLQPDIVSFGAVEGRIDDLLGHSGLRFVIWDSIFNLRVTCETTQEQEQRMRELWKKDVIVEGMVARDPDTGRPKRITEITDLEVMPQPTSGEGPTAWGAVPREPDERLPEEIIRKTRDAE